MRWLMVARFKWYHSKVAEVGRKEHGFGPPCLALMREAIEYVIDKDPRKAETILITGEHLGDFVVRLREDAWVAMEECRMYKVKRA